MKEQIELLKKSVILNKNKIPYINLNENNTYKGWVSDFHISFINGESMKLDLSEEKDLFLLFVLAIAWSRSGQWENAAYFVAYLKYHGYSMPLQWKNKRFVDRLCESRYEEADRIYEYCIDRNPIRRQISFREDIYESIYILACRWEEILTKLNEANRNNDYESFVYFMRDINGLGYGKKKMLIKITLILRELRCQNIYHNIPGYLCCVPDERVKVACKKIGISLPVVQDAKGLIRASAILYGHFGDLYDIPPFAYDDVMEKDTVCEGQTKKIYREEITKKQNSREACNMKTDAKTMEQIEKLFQLYEQEVTGLENKGVILSNTTKTYLLHSGNFVRWCKGEFEPGSKKKR